MTVALALGGVLAALCVVWVARPYLREPAVIPEADRLHDLDESARRLLELAEERDRALAALKELEFEHRAGKISDADYRELVGSLRAEAAGALAALDVEGREG